MADLCQVVRSGCAGGTVASSRGSGGGVDVDGWCPRRSQPVLGGRPASWSRRRSSPRVVKTSRKVAIAMPTAHESRQMTNIATTSVFGTVAGSKGRTIAPPVLVEPLAMITNHKMSFTFPLSFCCPVTWSHPFAADHGGRTALASTGTSTSSPRSCRSHRLRNSFGPIQTSKTAGQRSVCPESVSFCALLSMLESRHSGWSPFSSWWCPDGVAFPRLGAEHRNLSLEVVGRLEPSVDAGEPEVGDLVELTQRHRDVFRLAARCCSHCSALQTGRTPATVFRLVPRMRGVWQQPAREHGAQIP